MYRSKYAFPWADYEHEKNSQVLFQISETRISKWFLVYETVEAPLDFFKRLLCIVVECGKQVVHRFSADTLSTFLYLANEQFIKNKKSSKLYVPLPRLGLEVLPATFQVSVVFKRYQNEHERLTIFYQAEREGILFQEPRQITYPTLSPSLHFEIPKDQKQVSFEIPFLTESLGLYQVVFQIPDANHCVSHGALTLVPKTEHILDSIKLYSFADPYDAVVLDKILFEMPLPKSSLFTLTMTNWVNWNNPERKPYAIPYGFKTILELGLDWSVPEDQRPKELMLDLFCIVSVTRTLDQ
jgi:hypothetical protein